MATLTLQNLVKIFSGNIRAVDDLSLSVGEGELLVLVGPSGCGKTTILRMIAGLETPTSGSITIDGEPVNHLAPCDRDVAMVFQDYALYPHLTVAGNLAFGLKMRRVSKEEIGRRVDWAAGLLGIKGLLDRRPKELSGGECQRVALGRAIVRQPKVFLFDEPLSNLDAGLRARMRHEIRRLHARLGTTTVYVTHDQTEAMTLGQRIAVMRDGKLQQVADPQTLYDQPANRFVAELIGTPAMNFVAGRIERREGGLVFEGGEHVTDAGNERSSFTLPVPERDAARLDSFAGKPITLGIRPEHVACGGASANGAPSVAAVVESIEPLGPEAYVYITLGSQVLLSRVAADHRLSPGDKIEPAMDAAHWHFFDPRTEQAIA